MLLFAKAVEVSGSLESYLPASIGGMARFGAPMPCLLAPSPLHRADTGRRATRASCGVHHAAADLPEDEATPAEVAMLLFVPCRTAMRGKFPLNGTYFQSNEVFLVSSTVARPVMVRRSCPAVASRAVASSAESTCGQVCSRRLGLLHSAVASTDPPQSEAKALCPRQICP